MNKKIILIGVGVVCFAAIAGIVWQFAVVKGCVRSAFCPKKTEQASAFKDLLDQGDERAALKEISGLMSKSQESPELESALVSLASFYEQRGDLIKARDYYQKAIEKFPASPEVGKAQETLDNLNIKMIFSPTVAENAFIYEVQPGDSLAKIAKKFNTTLELIRSANNLTGSNIMIGQRLKIAKPKFGIYVDKSQNILILKADGNILKTYNVSTGANNSTPTGTFKIVNRIANPTWYTAGTVVPADSPKNILGTRWMGISVKGYGIHGTTEPERIGQSVTSGCVRMKNEDAEELYTIVPEGTEVVIAD